MSCFVALIYIPHIPTFGHFVLQQLYVRTTMLASKRNGVSLTAKGAREVRYFLLFSTCLLTSCSLKPDIKTETCEFNFTVLGYENARVKIASEDVILFDELTHNIIPGLDITRQSNFSLSVPAFLIISVDDRREQKLNIPNCDRLGVILSERPKDIRLVHMDNYVFY